MTPLAISVPDAPGSPHATRGKFAFYGNRQRDSENSSLAPGTSTSDASPYASPMTSPSMSPLASPRVQIVPFGSAYRHTRQPSDESLSHLPPLPVSPRWDSMSNPSRFILGQSISQRAGSPFDSPHSPSPLSYDTAASTPVESRNTSPTFLTSKSSLADLRAYDSLPPTVENFSRPRKQSIRQPMADAPKPRPVHISSCQSSSTYHSVLSPPSNDFYEPRAPRARTANGATASAARPPLSYSNPGSASPSPVVAPWMSGEEFRSSFRSQFTESTAPGTAVTERSSVLTKDSSVTSLYPSPEGEGEQEVNPENDNDPEHDEPSLEDVMGINSRPVTSTSDMDQRHSIRDDADDEDFPQRKVQESNSTLDMEIRMSKMIFTHPAFTSSVPHIAENYGRGMNEKRDSAKSLDSEPSLNEQPSSAVEPTPTSAPPVSTPLSPVVYAPPPPVIAPEPVEPEDPGARDRYGFKKENQYVTRQQYDTWNAGYTEYLARRRKKWNAYLKDNALMTDHPNRFPAPNAKTKRFVRKGIPPEWRGAAWFYYAGGPAILAKHSGLYDKLTTKRAKDVDAEAIERDLHRTFPDNIKFKPPGGMDTASSSARESQSTMSDSTRGSSPAPPNVDGETPIITSLRRVLHAFAVYNPRIGYCQSLNFLAGLLLLFVDTEEQCFWLLNVITRIYLPGTHEMSLEGSKIDLGVLMTEMRTSMPAVWDKVGGELEADPNSRPSTSKSIRLTRSRRKELARMSTPTDRLPPITLCMTAWFMSCFIGTLPIETTLRVWDVFFYEGSKTLFRIALAIFKLGESEIRAVADPMEMFGVVQSMPRRLIDANALMEACFKRRNGFGHLSQVQIDEKRQQRRAKAQLDRVRQGKTWNVG
ncbi:Rab-GTPase-TBC domain [Fusarium oxysporum f. sp. vasinfectum]|nr:Rab-GTPase-TBC domain [Fusarium oxysporum f. sp. vasinfectum]